MVDDCILMSGEDFLVLVLHSNLLPNLFCKYHATLDEKATQLSTRFMAWNGTHSLLRLRPAGTHYMFVFASMSEIKCKFFCTSGNLVCALPSALRHLLLHGIIQMIIIIRRPG